MCLLPYFMMLLGNVLQKTINVLSMSQLNMNKNEDQATLFDFFHTLINTQLFLLVPHVKKIMLWSSQSLEVCLFRQKTVFKVPGSEMTEKPKCDPCKQGNRK